MLQLPTSLRGFTQKMEKSLSLLSEICTDPTMQPSPPRQISRGSASGTRTSPSASAPGLKKVANLLLEGRNFQPACFSSC